MRTRNTKNCDATTSNTEEQDCCSTGDWSNWSECDDTGKRSRTRTNINCDTTFDNETQDCCKQGEWSDFGPCDNNKKERYRINNGVTCSTPVDYEM